MLAEKPLYQPSVWQSEYHMRQEDEVLGAGSAGPGKSMCLLMDIVPRIQQEHDRCLVGSRRGDGLTGERLDELRDYPLRWGHSEGWGLHLRRTRPMLEQTIARSHRIFPILDPDAKWDAQHTTWQFKSGYRSAFGHCRHTEDYALYLSNQYDHLAFDELTQFEQEQYEQLRLRVRSSDVLLAQQLKTRTMSNPFISRELGGTGGADNYTVNDPMWVKRYFVDPAPMGGVVLKRKLKLQSGEDVFTTRLYLRASLYDNPDKNFVRQYEIRLQSAKPHLRDAYLHGRWDVTVGSHFGDEWNHRLHVCKPFKPPVDWPVFRSMDWGYKMPGVVHWWAMDEDDNLFCVHEIMFKLKSPRDVAYMIERYEKEMGWWRIKKSGISGPADTQLWEERGDITVLPKAQEFGASGVPWVPADKRSRYRNAQLLMDRLRDHDNGTTTPGIVFFDTCQHAIRTIPAIPSEPTDPEMPKDGGDDHAYDSVSYACAFASHGRKGIRKLPPKREPWETEPADVPHDRGRMGYGSW